MALAVVTMLALTITPHHHHEGIACLITELCEEDGSVNDEHTDHDAQHRESCVAESAFISNADSRTKCKVASCDKCNPGHDHTLPIFCLAVGFSDYSVQAAAPEPWSGEFITGYKSVDPHRGNSLRAPPHTLC